MADRGQKKRKMLTWAGCIVGLILLDFLFTGVRTVQENEQGVILCFGSYRDTAPPGLVFILPWPIEEMIVISTGETRKMPVGFRFTQGLDPTSGFAEESEWLTGDTNVIDLEMMIHYTISNPSNYLFNIGPVYTDFLIRKCSESVLTEIMGVMPVDAILTTEKTRIERETLIKMQELLRAYDAGVTLSRASLQKIAPPEEVIEAFNDVTRAKADRERYLEEADGYMRDTRPRARAEASNIEQQALTYQSRVLSEAKGRAERFKSIYEEYRKAPAITRTRLFQDTIKAVLDRPRKIVVNPDEEGRTEVKVVR